MESSVITMNTARKYSVHDPYGVSSQKLKELHQFEYTNLKASDCQFCCSLLNKFVN
jgi:hypothetical protein